MKTFFLVAAILLCGCSKTDHPPFPKELIFEGAPIHPYCIVGTQWGDSSRFEPISLCDPLLDYRKDNENYRIVSEELSFDPISHLAEYNMQYSVLFLDHQPTYTDYTNYQYIGTFQNKHVILTSFFDSSATGIFGTLGLLKRVNDTIVNAGEITAGDRAHGGWIFDAKLKNHLLTYSQSSTPDFAMHAILNESLGEFFPPNFSYVSIKYSVDLNDPNLVSHLEGLIFDEDYTPCEFQEEKTIESCFYSVVDEYVKEGKYTLDLMESVLFAEKVKERIEKQTL
ncbi:MAG: hypothetical protein KAR79_04065 [Simkaniaceae bacterium]|nr:hypothetical protein [Simkaniaceae bacterium]